MTTNIEVLSGMPVDLTAQERDDLWQCFPDKLQVIRTGDFIRLGTLTQAIGGEAAEAFFTQPSVYDEARRSAALILRRGL